MIFSGAGLSLYFNKATFAVERMAAEADPEALSFVTGKSFGLPYGNNFLVKSEYGAGAFSAEFLYFNEMTCSVVVSEKQDAILFTYEFKNDGKEPISLQEGEVGICLPFFDRYDDAELSLRRRVHAHLRTEGTCYAYCERYSGEAPSLGMVMTQGQSCSYALERGVTRGDRGEMILRLPAMTLPVGESYHCSLCFFLCCDREDFFRKANEFGVLTVDTSGLVVFKGEEVTFRSDLAEVLKTDGGSISFKDGEARLTASGVGEHCVEISRGDQVIKASYFVLPDTLLANRTHFVASHRYVAEGKCKGAFAAYDYAREGKILRGGMRAYDGYCAAPLLLLLHEGAEGRLPDELKSVVDDAIAFYDREIYRGGEVADGAGIKRALLGKTYENYPLFAAIKYEEYRYAADLAALVQSAVILNNYFNSAPSYALTPVTMVAEALRKERKEGILKELIQSLSAAADRLLPENRSLLKKVDFSAQFLCGAFSLLLDAYALTNDEKYLAAANALLPAFRAFTFPAHLYRTDEIPEIFLKDKGKGVVYDMAPHYTAIHFAVACDKYYRVTKDEKYLALSRKIALACMTLFDETGVGFSSRSAAYSVNDLPLSSYEEISCGEDVVLYHFDLLFGRK